MSTRELLVRFYELSGPKPWSWACWCTRFALNYKGIPYTTVKLSYPAIKPECDRLFPNNPDIVATVPIIEILQPPYQALNDSTPIAKLLNERFTEKDGYRDLKLVDKVDEYEETALKFLGRPIVRWIMNDVYENALDKEDGSREYFKTTREEKLGCELKDLLEVKGGGEAAVLEDMREQWKGLRERMAGEDGSGEPTYMDFYDAAHFKWIEGASEEKAAKLMNLYGDDTFTKLMKKVGPYSSPYP
ncbi:hypothetical protein ACMFMG_000543 [Clarireedia jacksonii]